MRHPIIIFFFFVVVVILLHNLVAAKDVDVSGREVILVENDNLPSETLTLVGDSSSTSKKCEITIRNCNYLTVFFSASLTFSQQCQLTIDNIRASEIIVQGDFGGAAIHIKDSVFISAQRSRPALSLFGSLAYTELRITNSLFRRVAMADGSEDGGLSEPRPILDCGRISNSVAAVCIKAPACTSASTAALSCSSALLRPKIVLDQVRVSVDGYHPNNQQSVYAAIVTQNPKGSSLEYDVCPCWELSIVDSEFNATAAHSLTTSSSRMEANGISVREIPSLPQKFDFLRNKVRASAPSAARGFRTWSSETTNPVDNPVNVSSTVWRMEENEFSVSSSNSEAFGIGLSGPGAGPVHKNLFSLFSLSKNRFTINGSSSATAISHHFSPYSVPSVEHFRLNDNRVRCSLVMGNWAGVAFYSNFFQRHSVSAEINRNVITAVAAGIWLNVFTIDGIAGVVNSTGFDLIGNAWELVPSEQVLASSRNDPLFSPRRATFISFIYVSSTFQFAPLSQPQPGSMIRFTDNTFIIALERNNLLSLHQLAVVAVSFQSAEPAPAEQFGTLLFQRNTVTLRRFVLYVGDVLVFSPSFGKVIIADNTATVTGLEPRPDYYDRRHCSDLDIFQLRSRSLSEWSLSLSLLNNTVRYSEMAGISSNVFSEDLGGGIEPAVTSFDIVAQGNFIEVAPPLPGAKPPSPTAEKKVNDPTFAFIILARRLPDSTNFNVSSLCFIKCRQLIVTDNRIELDQHTVAWRTINVFGFSTYVPLQLVDNAPVNISGNTVLVNQRMRDSSVPCPLGYQGVVGAAGKATGELFIFRVCFFGESSAAYFVVERNLVLSQCISIRTQFLEINTPRYSDIGPHSLGGYRAYVALNWHIAGDISVSHNRFLVGAPCDAAPASHLPCTFGGPRGTFAVIFFFTRVSGTSIYLVGDLFYRNNDIDIQQATPLATVDTPRIFIMEPLRTARSILVEGCRCRYRREYLDDQGGAGWDLTGKSSGTNFPVMSLIARRSAALSQSLTVRNNSFENLAFIFWGNLHVRGASNGIFVYNNTLIATYPLRISRAVCPLCPIAAMAVVRLTGNSSLSDGATLEVYDNRLFVYAALEGLPPALVANKMLVLSAQPFSVHTLMLGPLRERIFYSGRARIVVRNNLIEVFGTAAVASQVSNSGYFEIDNSAMRNGDRAVFPLGGEYFGGSLQEQQRDWPSEHSIEFEIVGNTIVTDSPRAMIVSAVTLLPGTSPHALMSVRDNTVLQFPPLSGSMLSGGVVSASASVDETAPLHTKSNNIMKIVVADNSVTAARPGEIYTSAIVSRNSPVSSKRARYPAGFTQGLAIFLAQLPVFLSIMARSSSPLRQYQQYDVELRHNKLRTGGVTDGGVDVAMLLGFMSPLLDIDAYTPQHHSALGQDKIADSALFSIFGNIVGRSERDDPLYRAAVATDVSPDSMRADMPLLPSYMYGGPTALVRAMVPESGGGLRVAIGAPCNVVWNLRGNDPETVASQRVLAVSFFRHQIPGGDIYVVGQDGHSRVENEKYAPACTSFSFTRNMTESLTLSSRTRQLTKSSSATFFVEPTRFGMSTAAAAAQIAAATTLGAVAGLSAPAAALTAARAMATFALMSCGSTDDVAQHRYVPLWFGWQLEAPAAVGLFVGMMLFGVSGALAFGVILVRRRRSRLMSRLESVKFDLDADKQRERTQRRRSNSIASVEQQQRALQQNRQELREERALLEIQQHAWEKKTLLQSVMQVAPATMFAVKTAAQLVGVWGVGAGVLVVEGAGGVAIALLPLILLLAGLGYLSWQTQLILHPHKRPRQQRAAPPPPRVAPSVIYRPPSAPTSGISQRAADILVHPVTRFLLLGWYCWVPTKTDASFFDVQAVQRSKRCWEDAYDELVERQWAADLLMRATSALVKFWGPGVNPRRERRQLERERDDLDVGLLSRSASGSSSGRGRDDEQERPRGCYSFFVTCEPDFEARDSKLLRLRTMLSPHFLVAAVFVTVVVCLAQGAATAVGDRNGGCTHAMRFVATANFIFAVVTIVCRPFLIPLQNTVLCAVEAVVAMVSVLASGAVYEAGRDDMAAALQQAVATTTTVGSVLFMFIFVGRQILMVVAKAEVVPRSEIVARVRQDTNRELVEQVEKQRRADEDNVSGLFNLGRRRPQQHRHHHDDELLLPDPPLLPPLSPRQSPSSGRHRSPQHQQQQQQREESPSRATAVRSFKLQLPPQHDQLQQQSPPKKQRRGRSWSRFSDI